MLWNIIMRSWHLSNHFSNLEYTTIINLSSCPPIKWRNPCAEHPEPPRAMPSWIKRPKTLTTRTEKIEILKKSLSKVFSNIKIGQLKKRSDSWFSSLITLHSPIGIVNDVPFISTNTSPTSWRRKEHLSSAKTYIHYSNVNSSNWKR